MDFSASASSTFWGVEVVWWGVGVASIRGGVGGHRLCASFGLLLVVLECGTGLGSRSRWCVCDDASRRLSLCCTRAKMCHDNTDNTHIMKVHDNMSFLSAKAGSISRVMISGCPPFATCIVHILISCSITRNSDATSHMCRSTLSGSAIGLSCSGGCVERCFGYRAKWEVHVW